MVFQRIHIKNMRKIMLQSEAGGTLGQSSWQCRKHQPFHHALDASGSRCARPEAAWTIFSTALRISAAI